MFSIPFEVRKSVVIGRPVGEVFGALGDFGTWARWSPWLCLEPDCPVRISGAVGQVGHSQFWDGKLIGSGEMVLEVLEANQSLDYALRFLKPWKSSSRSGFELRAVAEGTEVTWWMRGSLPFFLFFLKGMMTAMVGGDFFRGLSMLKEYLETGEVVAETRVQGRVARPGFFYLCKRRACSVAEVGPLMEEDLRAMGALVESGAIPKPEQVFSIYHRFDMVKGQCEYSSGFMYGSRQEAPAGVEAGQVPAHHAVQVDHKGPYRHLGNAWSGAMASARGQHKVNKKLPMYEVYLNSPHEVPEDQVQTRVFVPVK
jgi:effector-binding domain-containing protein